MSLEFLDELENKINGLIGSLQQTRKENEEKDNRIKELEELNGNLKSEIEKAKTDSSDKSSQLDTTVDKIKGIISKLENIE